MECLLAGLVAQTPLRTVLQTVIQECPIAKELILRVVITVGILFIVLVLEATSLRHNARHLVITAGAKANH